MALGFGLTNATKALILAVLSAGIGLGVAFGFEVSGEQVAALNGFVDTVLALWVALSASESPALDPNKSAFTGSTE